MLDRRLAELQPELASSARERLGFLLEDEDFEFDDDVGVGSVAFCSDGCTVMLVVVPASGPGFHNLDLWIADETVPSRKRFVMAWTGRASSMPEISFCTTLRRSRRSS